MGDLQLSGPYVSVFNLFSMAVEVSDIEHAVACAGNLRRGQHFDMPRSQRAIKDILCTVHRLIL